MIWSRSRDIHLFLINNFSLDTDQYSPPALRWHVEKNTSTDRVVNSCHCNNTKTVWCWSAYREGLLCDVRLVANDNIEVPAHRVVLAACSHYFYSMFTSELTESRQDRVTLCQIDGSTLMLLVDFMYTSEILVAEDNVQVWWPVNVFLALLYIVANNKLCNN